MWKKKDRIKKKKIHETKILFLFLFWFYYIYSSFFVDKFASYVIFLLIIKLKI